MIAADLQAHRRETHSAFGHALPVRSMAYALFRFYEELNDFLPLERRKAAFAYEFDRRASVKDMIEALEVPHPEVELILANGTSGGRLSRPRRRPDRRLSGVRVLRHLGAAPRAAPAASCLTAIPARRRAIFACTASAPLQQ